MESAKSHLELDKMETNGSHVRMFTPEVPKPVREKRENICVYVRVRPTNAIEKAKGATLIVDCPSQREVYVKGRDTMGSGSKTFSFDKVFGPNSKQIEVYKAVVGPLLEEVLQGYNCTVFAYGQTGTGKTFTMEGDRTKEVSYTWETDPLAGIVPRAMNQLFDELRVKGSDSEFTVRVSLVEMYNEEVYDLLSPAEDAKPKSVKLFEDPSKKGSVYIQGLEEVIVRNKHEVYSIMERGSQMRKTASTLLNATSSRSHTVFTVTVHLKETSLIGEDLVKIGKLNLVDLAGSENIGRSGAIEKRAREAGNINQSLLTLGRVITALVEKAPHVPYRESKLTRLLQDSLGGKTKTSIIATISPASNNIEETLSTLDYAHRAKNIQNRPEVNQKMTKKAMLKEYTDEIERLRKDLAAAREKNGIYVDKENYDQIMSQIESQSQDLSEKIQYVKSIEEDVVNKEQIIMEKDAIINETKEELKAADLVILGLREKIAELEKKNSEIENEKQEMEHLVNVHSTTESKLSTEAKTLLNTTKETTTTLDCLYNRLERKKSVETANLEAGKRFRADADEQLRGLAKEVSHFGEREAGFAGKQRMKLNDHLSQKESSARAIEEFVMESNAQVKSLMEKVYEALEKQQNVVQKGLRDQLQLEHVQTDQLRSDLSNHCESMSKSSDDVRQKINYQSGKLNEFWDSTYLIDLPTGATPQRKMYEYPSALSATSPHARILERYRAVKFPKLSELEVEPDSPPVENQSPPNELIEPLSTSTEEDDEVFGENINPATSTSSSSDNLTGLASAAAPLPKGKGKFGGRLVSDSTANNASTKMSAKSNASKSKLQKKLSRKVLISANSN